jgi:hypothetical protein
MRLFTVSLLAGLLLPLTALTGGGSTAPRPHPTPADSSSPGHAQRPFIAYGPQSFLQSRLTGAPINQTLTQQFHQFMATFHDQAGTNYPTIHGVEGNKWGMPFAISGCSDPLWRIGSASGSAPPRWSRLRGTGFHAPADMGAQLTGTNDSPFVVIDRCDHITVWASNARVAGDHVMDVKSFGAFEHASNGLDRRNPRSNSPKNFRSRGVIPDSMLIRQDEMHYAVVHHTDLGQVLEFFFVETNGNGQPCFTSPMVACEPRHDGWGREGLRIAVAPRVDLTTRSCSPQALVIARTLKDYGGYLGDNSGGSTGLKAQQATPGHPVWHGVLTRDELKGCISWQDFVVIKPGWQ